MLLHTELHTTSPSRNMVPPPACCPPPLPPPKKQQEKDTIRLKREAKASGGFYVEPEAKLAFVMRIRGLNKIHPKVGGCVVCGGGGAAVGVVARVRE